MTRRKFDELVERVEARYHGRPAALQRATATWVGLGLAGILAWVGFLLITGTLLFICGIVVVPPTGLWILGIGVLLIVFGVRQACLFLLVDIGSPKGRQLKPTEAPALWHELESLRRKLQCRPLSGVFLSMEFNAAVRKVPRLGLLGWPRTYQERKISTPTGEAPAVRAGKTAVAGRRPKPGEAYRPTPKPPHTRPRRPRPSSGSRPVKSPTSRAFPPQ